MNRIRLSLRETIRKYKIFSEGDGVLLGVSGGPDSIALLYSVVELEEELGLRLAVGHVNHGLRRGEAKKDALFVRGLAEKLGIPFHLTELELPGKLAKVGGGNLEDWGRRERYGFFASTAERLGFYKVATGHTRDDQVETVLMWLLRGTGRRGLSGMPMMRPLDPWGRDASIWLVRPLLEFSRQEILDYLEDRGVSYRLDATNFDRRLMRSWIRQDLLPYLRGRVGIGIDERLAHLADILREEERVLDGAVQSASERSVGKDGLCRRSFLQEEKGIQRRLIRGWLGSHSTALASLEFRDVEAVLSFLEGGKPQGRLSLPGGWDLVRKYDLIRIEGPKTGAAACSRYRYSLPPEGDLVIPEARMKVESTRMTHLFPNRPSTSLEALFDSAYLPRPLTVRNFHPGDRFRPLGMTGHKKVKDLFIEKKVPVALRRRLPLILCGEEILWIPQCGRSDFAKVSRGTKEILRVRLTPLSGPL